MCKLIIYVTCKHCIQIQKIKLMKCLTLQQKFKISESVTLKLPFDLDMKCIRCIDEKGYMSHHKSMSMVQWTCKKKKIEKENEDSEPKRKFAGDEGDNYKNQNKRYSLRDTKGRKRIKQS